MNPKKLLCKVLFDDGLQLETSDRIVFAALVALSDGRGLVDYGLEGEAVAPRLQRAAHLTRRTVDRSLRTLEAADLIEVIRRKHQDGGTAPNAYRVLVGDA
jgi:hypothetical protein